MKPPRFFLNRFLWTTLFIAVGFGAKAQPPKRVINPNLFRTFIRSGTQLKIQTVDKGRVEKTDSTSLTEFTIPVKTKAVISLKNTTPADSKSLDDFKATLKTPYAKDQVNVIPELHVETGEAQSEDKAYGIVFTIQQPLHYDQSIKKFSAKLSFLLASATDDNYKPIEPVKIEVISDEVSSIDPRNLNIDHLSIPSTDVNVAVDHVRDSIKIRVITVSNTAGYTTWLKVRQPIEISTNQTTLQGFGIQQTSFTVTLTDASSPDSVKVSFSPQKGTVSPNPVYISYNNPALVNLRSDGIGNSNLSATSAIGNSNVLTFRYTFPWLFLLAAIIGGLIGSLAKYFLGGGGTGSPVKPIIGGILIGFIGAIAYYGLGLNLLGVSLSAGLNAFAVLALSALCAYFGISLIKMDGKT